MLKKFSEIGRNRNKLYSLLLPIINILGAKLNNFNGKQPLTVTAAANLLAAAIQYIQTNIMQTI